jgi:uncharacterized membrane protein (DUF373 family)
MLLGLLISFLALIGFIFAIVLLLTAILKYSLFLIGNRENPSAISVAVRYIFIKDQADNISVTKVFLLSVVVSASLVFFMMVFGG